MTTPEMPPPGWYADPTGAFGQRYWTGSEWQTTVGPTRRAVAATTNAARHRTVWIALGGLSLLASGALLACYFAFNGRNCSYLPDQPCTQWAYLGGWVEPISLLLILVVIVTAVTLAVRWRRYPVRLAAFVVASLVIPVMLLVPGTPLHPRVDLGKTPATQTVTTAAPAPDSPAGGVADHSASYQQGMISAREGVVHQDIAAEKEMGGVDMNVPTEELDCQVRSIAAENPDDFVKGCEDFLENRVG